MKVGQLCELVVSSNMSVICRQGHQEVNQRQDDDEAGHCGKDEHQCGVLDKVDTKQLDLPRSADLHVVAQSSCRREEGEIYSRAKMLTKHSTSSTYVYDVYYYTANV